jgi:hypothetical protein
VIAALTDRQRAREAHTAGTTGHAADLTDDAVTRIRAAFTGLCLELGIPALEQAGGADTPPSNDPAPEPPQTDPAPPARTPASGHATAQHDEGFPDIRAAFADLRQASGLPAADQAEDTSSGSAPDPDSIRRLDDAIAEAQACATWYRDTPEWQRTGRVAAAARALITAIRETAGDYWAEIRQDVRVRGFARTVTARACLAIAGTAHVLADSLERSGHQQARAWRAAWGLHQAATGYADRLMHYRPPGNSDRMREVSQIINDLADHPHNPHPRGAAPANGSRAHPAASAVSPATLAQAAFPRSLSRMPFPRPAPDTDRHPVHGAAPGTRHATHAHR